MSVGRFEVLEIRYEVVNPGTAAFTFRPALEVGAGASPATFSALPAGQPDAGHAFYLAAEPWLKPASGNAALPPAEQDLTRPDDPAADAVTGLRMRGIAVGPAVTVPPGGRTEIEVSVRATADAEWSATYSFRLVDAPASGAAAPVGGLAAQVVLGAKPPIDLTSGQHRGVDVGPAVPAYRLVGPSALGPEADTTAATYLVGPASDAGSGDIAATALLVGPDMPDTTAPDAPGFSSPHGGYGLTTSACAACHRTHSGSGASATDPVTGAARSQATLCFSCHDGSGSVHDVRAEFADPAVPANDPATDAYFVHPATAGSTHTSDTVDEFGGVANRHAACTDCHNAHAATGDPSTQTTAGWTVAGSETEVTGVAVANGAAGASPGYAVQLSSATLEYQVCLKCHSGYTILPAQDPAHPSRWALDKGVELNPSNASYHPVEAAGTNTTSQMAASLSGTSPYKLWNFATGSTVRCVNCHASSSNLTPASPPDPGAELQLHAGQNAGLLLGNYRDRILMGPTEDYAAANFQLCYVCHAESPYVDTSGDPNAATQFRYHGLHIAGNAGQGSGTSTDIETAGAGAGNATCAECHYRIHSTALAVNADDRGNARLVNFAPDVQPVDGVLRWDPSPGGGTCTLTCHGVRHDGYSY